MLHLLKTSRREPIAPEEAFTEKYDWLLKWALHFAQGDQAQAEDLVQDTFVRFVVSESELKDPEGLEPLLYTYLKFVHLSHLRRAQRYPLQQLPLVDFDSIHLALRETPSVDAIEMQDALRRIVAYLAWRKERAKSAGILLLRFFHGYRKDEIMRIGLLSDRVVANGLMLAREETRKHLAGGDPQSPANHLSAFPVRFPSGIAVPHDQLLAELRRSILETCRSPCLPKDRLLSHYQALDPKPIDCKLFAHLVSCERCLDLVSRLHGMPPLSGRSPDEMLGGVRRTKFGLRGKGTGEDGPQRVLRIARQRLRDLHDHQPRELKLAVNGRIVASRDVSSAISKLEVEISPEIQLEFMEIVSEQGVCLLAMPVNAIPPKAPPEMRHSARLMNDRAVEMVLHFTSVGPFVDISYSDPSLPLSATATIAELAELAADDKEEMEDPPQRVRQDSARGRPSLPLRMFRRARSLRLPLMNPLLTTALVLAVASTVCFYLGMKQRPVNVTANAFLARAGAWDPTSAKNGPRGVVRQKVRIRTPQTTFQHTLYRDAQGLRTPKPATLFSGEERWRARLSAAHVRWEDPLSAASYQDWRDSQRSRQDEIIRSGDSFLTLKTTVPQGDVVQETITVRESDFHPVERTVEFRDSGDVEIAELDYDVLPWQPASEGWFEPLATAPARGVQHSAVLPHVPHLLSEEEFDETELSARLALNQMGADASERMDVLRVPSGIQVKGIVATEARKQEIERRLRALPHVIPALFTFDELRSGRTFYQPETSVRLSSTVAELTPLEQYLLANGMSREDIGRLADQLFDDSAAVSQGSKAIEGLLERFPADRKRSESARAALAQLLAAHKKQILAAIDAEERLASITGTAVPSIAAEEDSPNFKESAEKNVALCRELVANGIVQPRPARVILPELLVSAAQLRAGVLRLSPDTLAQDSLAK